MNTTVEQLRAPDGKFAQRVCVSAHDRCGEVIWCPYCEYRHKSLNSAIAVAEQSEVQDA